MTRSNRLLNRGVLLVTGLALLAAAAWAAARTPAVGDLLPFGVPAIPTLSGTPATIVAAAAVLVAGIAIAVAATRGRGVTRDIRDDGDLRIAGEVPLAIVRGELAGHPDVAAVSGAAYRVRGSRALLIRIAVRPGAQLPRLLEAARHAVDRVDAELEERVPVVLHLIQTSRGSAARDRRVD